MAAAAVLYAAAVLLSLRKKQDGAWLEREDTTALRGVLAVFILFVHLPDACRYFSDGYAETFEPFIFQGHLAVGVFFALSGYGLAVSAGRGLAGFFRRRFFEVLLPYFLCSLVFLMAFRVRGEAVRFADMVKSWFSGDPLVTYSWYVVTQLIFYVFFYAAFRFFSDRKMKIAALFLCVLAYMLIVPRFGWPLVTTRGCLTFVLGAACGAYKRELDAFFAEKTAGRWVLVSGLLFLISHVLYFAVPFFKAHPVFDFSSALFAVFIFLLGRIIVPAGPLFHGLGNLSLEIYLYQGLAFIAARMLLLRFGAGDIFAYALVSILLAAAGACAVHFTYGAVRAFLVKTSIFKDKSA